MAAEKALLYFFRRGFLRALPECRHCWVRFSDDASPLIFAK